MRRYHTKLFRKLKRLVKQDDLIAYVDGSTAVKNPGIAGSACILKVSDDEYHTMCQNIGMATNNVAELTAVQLLLGWFVANPERIRSNLHIISDSEYSIGVCSGEKKAAANKELVFAIRDLINYLRDRGMDISFAWTAAHSKDTMNNTVDLLAKHASYNTGCEAKLNGVKKFNGAEFIQLQQDLFKRKSNAKI